MDIKNSWKTESKIKLLPNSKHAVIVNALPEQRQKVRQLYTELNQEPILQEAMREQRHRMDSYVWPFTSAAFQTEWDRAVKELVDKHNLLVSGH